MKELRGKQSGSPMGLIDFKISIVNLYQYSTVPRKSMTEVEEGLCELYLPQSMGELEEGLYELNLIKSMGEVEEGLCELYLPQSMGEVEEGLCELLCLDGLLGLGLEARQPAPVHFKFFYI